MAALKLADAHSKLRSGYSSSQLKEHVDGGSRTGADNALDNRLAFKALMDGIPAKYIQYVRVVSLEGEALWSMPGCTGGANHQQYLERLGAGLNWICNPWRAFGESNSP